jgi:hypothetical protein
MSQGTIALFILAPATINLSTKDRQLLIEPEAFGVIRWQGIPLLLILRHLLLEFVDLSSGASLSPIKPTGVEEKWPTDLLAVFVHGCSRQERVDAPICSEHPLGPFPGG